MNRIDYVQICKYVPAPVLVYIYIYIFMMQHAYMNMCAISVRSAEENDIEAAHLDTAHISLLNDLPRWFVWYLHLEPQP